MFKFPRFGLGTYRLRGADCIPVVQEALKLGYRMIDTAAVYRNEEQVGPVVRSEIASGRITRGDVFITSKLGKYLSELFSDVKAPKDLGYDETIAAVKASNEALNLDYIVHFSWFRSV